MWHYQWKWPCATICWHFTVNHHAVFLLKTARTPQSLKLILRCLNLLMGTTFLRHTIAGWLTRYIVAYTWRHSLEWLSLFSMFTTAITQHMRNLLNTNVKSARCCGLHFLLGVWLFILWFSGYDTVQSGRLLPTFRETILYLLESRSEPKISWM